MNEYLRLTLETKPIIFILFAPLQIIDNDEDNENTTSDRYERNKGLSEEGPPLFYYELHQENHISPYPPHQSILINCSPPLSDQSSASSNSNAADSTPGKSSIEFSRIVLRCPPANWTMLNSAVAANQQQSLIFQCSIWTPSLFYYWPVAFLAARKPGKCNIENSARVLPTQVNTDLP